jgi:hypothetical protein
MFGKRKRPSARPEVYDGLREQVLQLDPGSVGIGPSPTLPRVWGLVMDIGSRTGTATLVGLADGQRAVEAAEDDLRHRRHLLADIFHSAHDVLTELRLLDEARQG